MLKDAIKDRFRIIKNPELGFSKNLKKTFELAVHEYVILLVLLGALSGLVTIIFRILKAVYVDMFLAADVNYWYVINFALSIGTSSVFLFFFSGTVFFFILAMVLSLFYKKVKMVVLLQVMMYSLSPVFLFGWITYLLPSLVIWSTILFFVGIKNNKSRIKIRKDSLAQRD